MPCCLGCALLGFPRLAILALLLLTDYIGEAFRVAGAHRALIALGLLFLPWTTLWFAWAIHNSDGELRTWHWVILVFAALSDLGALKSGRSVVVQVED